MSATPLAALVEVANAAREDAHYDDHDYPAFANDGCDICTTLAALDAHCTCWPDEPGETTTSVACDLHGMDAPHELWKLPKPPHAAAKED